MVHVFNSKKMVFCFLLVAAHVHASTQEKSSAWSVLVGSVAGATEAGVNQPLVFFKNSLQQGKSPFALAKEAPGLLYKGLGVNLVCMVPTTAAQMGVESALERTMPESPLTRSFVAGALSATFSNPSELVIVNQQNWKANACDTMRRLYAENGAQVASRGFVSKALRDGTFGAGFLAVYPGVKDYLKKEQGLNNLCATVGATALVGPITAAVSHPFDTISTTMQADPGRAYVRGFVDAAQKVYASGGPKAFFAGFGPRAGRVMTAIPVMTIVKEKLSE